MYKLIISSLLFCIACINETEVSVIHSGDNQDTTTGLRYLALGDSYTIGESVPETDRWPVLFAKSMGENGRVISTTDILAKTGWTTANLLGACNGFKPKENYDLVSLLIGVNNQYQGRSLDEFRSDFHMLLLKSVEYAGDRRNRVFVLSIPDWGCTEFGSGNREETGKSIDKFNLVVKEECAKEKILFVDITPISRKALNDPTMVASDNLHYSKKMHQLWVDEALPPVKPLLSL
ncbi:SGNH/GDSL hydrolase family protein [Dyadobacter subterraneus]|uniref:SGNH/GDSL hydrolase family protein n=1 Tax=Dyadobacter subterraneus TaxID=2773304 RepID=A0ABR9WAN2_9BACT|nr:SGNH/GDSL hydrolase family protein [Dyadobacter subterraneus]MBE9462533.1 SGNH/GDSL hydrolase family protein [Dyadobacter subterraneus]